MSADDWRSKATPAVIRPTAPLVAKPTLASMRAILSQPKKDKRARDKGYVLHSPPPGERYGWRVDIDRHPGQPCWRLVLPFPPSKNALTGLSVYKDPTSGVYKALAFETKVAREYKAHVSNFFEGFPKQPKSTMLAVGGRIVMARAGSDLLNRHEVMMDALNGIAWDDDAQLAESDHWKREVNSDAPHVVMWLRHSMFDEYGKTKGPVLL